VTPLPRGLWAVAAREVRWLFSDQVAWFLLFGVPVIAFALLGFTFSSAVVRGLNVFAVDMDNSATSRLFIQTVAASPGITIAERGNDLGAAASAIRSGRAIAAIYLPPEFGKVGFQHLSHRAAFDATYRRARQLREPGFRLALGFIELERSAHSASVPARTGCLRRTEDVDEDR